MQESNLTGLLSIKNFLANHISIISEPFQRTDIGMKPLGPVSHVMPIHK
jgi:hypothetical protein